MMQWSVFIFHSHRENATTTIIQFSIVCDNKSATRHVTFSRLFHMEKYLFFINLFDNICGHRSITHSPNWNDAAFFISSIALFLHNFFYRRDFLNDINCNEGFTVCEWFHWEKKNKCKNSRKKFINEIMLKYWISVEIATCRKNEMYFSLSVCVFFYIKYMK